MEKYGWLPLGRITAALTALTVSQRTVQNITDVVTQGTNGVILDLTMATAEFAELRSHVSGSDGDVNVLEVYAARDENDDFTHVGQLSCTVGTMLYRGGSRLYHDTMTYTATDEAFQLVVSNSGNNDTAKAWFNTNSYKKLLVIASTLASTNITFEIGFAQRSEIPSTSDEGSVNTILNTINTNLEASSIDLSDDGGEEELTISSNTAQGSNQACNGCTVTWSGTGPRS
jgi:hypothetical protein